MLEGVDGSYMGVMGRFSCMDGSGRNNDDGKGICRINHHESGMMGVSEDDTVVFRPYVYTADTDWLAAGVWLTIPDDEKDGDYAIGAFVYGNDPYKDTQKATVRTIAGKATYVGEAFGRFAEDDAGNMETGRFTAMAKLTADFGEDSANGTGNDFGSIQGDLTGFMAEGEAQKWDVNFEQAMVTMTDVAGTITDNSVLKFNAGASGHGGASRSDSGGHRMVGYWNGQFYGMEESQALIAAHAAATTASTAAATAFATADARAGGDDLQTPAVRAANDAALAAATTARDDTVARVAELLNSLGQPGSAAGTFGLTTLTDPAYSLILGGAFATHNCGPKGGVCP